MKESENADLIDQRKGYENQGRKEKKQRIQYRGRQKRKSINLK